MSDSGLKVTDRRWWVNSSGTEASAETAEPATLKPTYIEELESRLASKDREIQELLTKYRGATEEFDHARARLRKEVTKDVERGRRSLIASFLDVLDNLDRALAAAGDRGDDPFVHGVSLVRQQFLSTLESLGVTRVDPLGQPFDPSRHEAAATVAPTHDAPEGHVVGVIRPGYLIGEEVLRPAMVAVSG